MAELQTNYTDSLAIAIVGGVLNGETSNRISRTIEDAGGIAFGRAAFRGTGRHGITATPTAGALLGITIAHSALGLLAGGVADTYPQYETVAIMTLGAIAVLAGEAVVKGDQAYVTPGGAFMKTAGGGNVILPGWFFDETIASGAIAPLVRR